MQDDDFSKITAAFLPQIVEAFLVAEGPEYSPTRLGKDAVKDPGKIFAIRLGAACRPATARKILDVIEKKNPGFAQRFLEKQLKDGPHGKHPAKARAS